MGTIPSSSHLLFCELALQDLLEDFGSGAQGNHHARGSHPSCEGSGRSEKAERRPDH